MLWIHSERAAVISFIASSSRTRTRKGQRLLAVRQSGTLCPTLWFLMR